MKENAEAQRALERERFIKMMDDHMADVGKFASPHERVMRQMVFARAWYLGFLYAVKIVAKD